MLTRDLFAVANPLVWITPLLTRRLSLSLLSKYENACPANSVLNEYVVLGNAICYSVWSKEAEIRRKLRLVDSAAEFSQPKSAENNSAEIGKWQLTYNN